MRRVCLIILMCLTSTYSNAQGTADGCLLPDNRVYTSYSSLLGARLYSGAEFTSLTPNYCSWSASSSSSCNVCFGSINVLALLCVDGPVVSGQRAIYTMVECGLDDYLWTFGAALGLTGIFGIRGRTTLAILNHKNR
ncbi:hypothetical protein QWY86_06045 [Pedobacter aquatilis]|uniref:hypothetical protein n=1 Tax=Pedobacter aquatilis TaxID=351343 RepID=UPI0025B33371|nr:hypothetical protein [Pedobacter aquatilis]MDN3586219.1 hypothetical protein [Pedobacter aquatilis]